MAQITTEEVVQFLKQRFEGRLDNAYQSGKHDMIKAIHEQFNIPEDEARDVIDALERNNDVRYVRTEVSGGETQTNDGTEYNAAVVYGSPSGVGIVGDSSINVPAGSLTGAPIPTTSDQSANESDWTDVNDNVGYWSIGRSDQD